MVLNHSPQYCTSSVIMSFMRASWLSLWSVAERTVGNTEGRRWMLGVERVKQTSLVGTVPMLSEEEGRRGRWSDKLQCSSFCTICKSQ